MRTVIGLILFLTFTVAMIVTASAASCETWQQECARFHEFQTRNWHACMHQPQARYDCGGGGLWRSIWRRWRLLPWRRVSASATPGSLRQLASAMRPILRPRITGLGGLHASAASLSRLGRY